MANVRLLRFGIFSSRKRPGHGLTRSNRRRGYRFEPLEPRYALSTTPLISEFMASNGNTIDDGDGNSNDWIEIWNPTPDTINLAGWHLTDNPNNLNKWTFPNAPQSILGPGQYLLVFASSQNTETYIDGAGYLHTDFALSAQGEYLALTDPSENVIHAYAPQFPPQVRDVSYGLLPNSEEITLVGKETPSTVLVPVNGDLDAPSAEVAPAWTLVAFNDDAWLLSPGVGVGFDAGIDDFEYIPDGILMAGGLLGSDLTDANDDGTLEVTWTAGDSTQSPAGSLPSHALDNSSDTHWLAFAPTGTFYQLRFMEGVRQAVNAYTITSAGNAPNRDPYSWTLSGSNDGINFTVVDAREAQDFAARKETRLYEFGNNTAYEYYRFDFQTEYGATGQNMPTGLQVGEIELLSSGPVNFDELIDFDVEAAWNTNPTSVYQRIEFDVEDPESLSTLLLEMQYDDGFIAYLNGTRVVSVGAPVLPNFNSDATSERDDADSLVPEKFNLTTYLDLLVEGTNVLSIHVLNLHDSSPDLLSRPKLTASRTIDDTVIEAFMLDPTPGTANSATGVSLGPHVQNVTENPSRPSDNDDLLITAEITAAGAPVADVTLYYRVMYGSEVAIAMNDDGTGGDQVAGDGIYSAAIPEQASSPGQMVRWYVVATDTIDATTRYPLFLNPNDSAQYLGTVVEQPNMSATLPTFEFFVENEALSVTEGGTRGSVYFLGEFYDNVFVRRRGGFTTGGRKFEFNRGQRFLFDVNEERVDEINLNSGGSEPTSIRQALSWEVYAAAGVEASIGQAWYTVMNGWRFDVRIFVEQPDEYLLARTGLDPDGAFYKIGDDGVQNGLYSYVNGVRKRTRKSEDNSDLQAFVGGIFINNPNRVNYALDNIDIAATINYIAATVLIHDNDHLHKNYHVYRDTNGTGQWRFIPWDKDLTFGINVGIPGVVGNQDPASHPFVGSSEVHNIHNQWNRMIDVVLDIPGGREMLTRRLRTLMDQMLSPPEGSEPSWLETRIEEFRTALLPHLATPSWHASVNQIIDVYLAQRRQHLYVNHGIHNPGYPNNAGIPDAQVGNPTIEISHIEHKPISGIRDEEYLTLHNPNNTAVDISYWRIEGDITHTFPPGTVIPAGGTLYLSPDVPAFLARTTGPRGNQGLFVQGNYSGNLANEGGTLYLRASDNSLIDQATTGLAGDYNFDQVVDQEDYNVWKSNYGSTLQLAGDGNGDGIVDSRDFMVWRNNLGATSLPAAMIAASPVEADPTEDAPMASAVAVATRSQGLSPNLAMAGSQGTRQTRASVRGEFTSSIAMEPATQAELFVQHSLSLSLGTEQSESAGETQPWGAFASSKGKDLASLELAFDQFCLGGLDEA